MLDGVLYIGAAARDANTSFRGYDPSTGLEIEPGISIADEADVAEACRLADAAFDGFRELTAARRAEFLEAIATNVSVLDREILERVHLETRLPPERLSLEFLRTVNQIRMFARFLREGHWANVVIETEIADRTPFRRPDLRQRRIGIGPVAVFGSSNFPLAFTVAGGDTIAAFAAGCPVVVKGHPAHPGTSAIVASAVREAVRTCGLDEGVFTLLQSPHNAIGAELVRDPRIKAVAFTGSRSGGLALTEIAARRAEPIPVFAEMSSVNPVILFPAALASRPAQIAAGYVASLTLGAGQLCTNPGIVIAIDGPGIGHFLDAAAGLIEEASAQTMLSPGIHAAYGAGVEGLARHEKVVTLARGIEDVGANRGRAALFTTPASAFIARPELAQEVFGATSLVVRAGSIDEVRAVLQTLEGQLAITVQVDDDDVQLARTLIPLIERKAGRILANGWPTGVEVSRAMVHGGPFPATSDSRATSVGTAAIERFLRPVCYQDLPHALLPAAVRSSNPEALPQAFYAN